MTFEEYVCIWKKQCRIKIGDGWKICQDQIIKDHIIPWIGRQDINSIKPGHISEVLNQSRMRGHSERQQRKIYMVMSKIFKDAVYFSEVIEKTPIRKEFHKPVIHITEAAFLTPDKLTDFLDYVKSHPIYSIPCWIQGLSGPRFSEVQALTVKDFDFKKDIIRVTKKYNRHTKMIEPFPKGGRPYYPQIPPKLKNFLLDRLPGSGLACPSFSGKIIHSKTYDDFLKRAFGYLGFSTTSSHDLRHSCATLYQEHGASDEAIQQLLGHKWLISTRTYIHRTNDGLRKIAEKIA